MSALQDLTGQTFGRLTVIGPAEDYVSPDGEHHAKYLCQCECGKQTAVLKSHLKSGRTKSCGCLRKKRKDLTGQTFGLLTVLGPAEDYVSPGGKHYTKWLCQCKCGKQTKVVGYSLKSGVTRSCGCENEREDFTGQTFGLLTVLGPAEDYVSPGGKHHTKWLCQCKCGGQIEVLGHNLKSGDTKSCGCLRKKRGRKPR